MVGNGNLKGKVLTDEVIHTTLKRMDEPSLSGIVPGHATPEAKVLLPEPQMTWAENTRGFFPKLRPKHNQPSSAKNLILPQRARILR